MKFCASEFVLGAVTSAWQNWAALHRQVQSVQVSNSFGHKRHALTGPHQIRLIGHHQVETAKVVRDALRTSTLDRFRSEIAARPQVGKGLRPLEIGDVLPGPEGGFLTQHSIDCSKCWVRRGTGGECRWSPMQPQHL